MILLDTNVVSETMKPAPNQIVQRWLDEQAAETLYLSSVTIAEAVFGIRTMPDGKRKRGLAEALDVWINLFEGRILPFDLDAARHYADLERSRVQRARGFRHRTATLPPSPPPGGSPS